MSWQNSNNPSRRPPDPRRTGSQPNEDSEFPPLGHVSPQSLSNTASNAAPLPRMIAAARERLASSNRERINSILGDSPYTTRRWTPAPGENGNQHQRQSRPSLPPSRFDVAPQISASPLPVSPPSGDFASQSPYPNRMTSLEQLDRTLDEANAHLRALLDMTSGTGVSRQLLQTNQSPSYTPTTRTHDFTYDDQRNKRRKVDEENCAHGVQSFRYGHYGQVEAGNLEMEIVSCDGGIYSTEQSYSAENILKDDNSVYCTKGNRCNMVLRHRGSTAFTVTELVIKAPRAMNYSHPVREGLVFITMEQDDVLHRTAQYQIQYAPTNTPSAGAARDRVTFTSTDPRARLSRETQSTVSVLHNRDGTTTTRSRQSFVYSHDAETRTPQMPREFSTSRPDFRISTDSSDEDRDTAVATPVSILRRPPPPNRIGTLPFERNDAESDSDLDEDHADATGFPSHNDALSPHRRGDPSSAAAAAAAASGSGTGSSSEALAEAWDAHANATQEAIRAVGGGGLLAPHARFYVDKKKCKCTIRFDPPVSGRFILLKMWSSHHEPGSNIDIQSVITRGFAGPRYFPAIDVR